MKEKRKLLMYSLSFLVIGWVILIPSPPARSETAFDRGRRLGSGAVLVNTIVFCLVAEKWITTEDAAKHMDYYQQKYGVPDSYMLDFSNDPRYYNAINRTIDNLGGCTNILDKEWNVK